MVPLPPLEVTTGMLVASASLTRAPSASDRATPPPANGDTYSKGENIEVEMTFSEPVTYRPSGPPVYPALSVYPRGRDTSGWRRPIPVCSRPSTIAISSIRTTFDGSGKGCDLGSGSWNPTPIKTCSITLSAQRMTFWLTTTPWTSGFARPWEPPGTCPGPARVPRTLADAGYFAGRHLEECARRGQQAEW